MKCDILVVGAGPAGSMTAKIAAEQGVDVIFIERNEKVGDPVRCAEGINISTFQDTGIEKDDSFIDQVIDGTKFYFYNEVYELNTKEWQGYVIDRKVFDKYLASQAEKAGAVLFTSTKAIGMKNKGDHWLVRIKSLKGIEEIETKIVIGAGGFKCSVGEWAGIRKKWKTEEFCSCLELLLACPELKEKTKFHMAFGEEFPMGYAWIFPKGGMANVGVGLAPGLSTQGALTFYINDYPGTNSILGENWSVVERRGGCAPSTGPKNVDEIVGDGVILVGDAAGIIDPILYEGITPAMISGIAAGEVASMGIKQKRWDKKTLSIYDKTWREKRYCGSLPLGEDLEMLTHTRELFYHLFTNRTIPKKARELLISVINLNDEEEITKSLSKIKKMISD
jgi:digeranylgeranylglycerophospholipid reductase